MPTSIALRYPKDRLTDDFLKSAGGLGISIFLLLAVPEAPLALIFAGLSGAAGLWLGREAIKRRYTLMRFDSKGIFIVIDAPSWATWLLRRKAEILWDDLTGFKLRWYATRRDRSQGWFELRLDAGRRRKVRLVADDRLEGFFQLLAAARDAARRNLVEFDEATSHNLAGASLPAQS